MTAASSLQQNAAGLDFGRTRWSVVLAVRGDAGEAQRSLAELCVRYWVPVYAYVRHSGHPPEAAAALVQAFLGHLVQEIRQGDPTADGGFRAFLQRRLETFLASDWRRLETAPPAPEVAPPRPLAQIEQRLRRAQSSHATPPQIFQRTFAVEVLESALEQLRQEAARSRRVDMFEALRPFLAREPGAGEYPELAARLQCSPLATVIAVKRLRQRYQELIDAQLVQTVGSAEALDAERSALLALLLAAPG
jgi:hypothetical protein